MKKERKETYLICGVVLIVLIFLASFYLYSNKDSKTEGIMILIESTSNASGLINMVSQMSERNIDGLLMITPEFANANCNEVKEALSYGNIEIVASNVGEPFWDIPYEEQKERINEMLEGIANCTGEKPRIISSRYMASDINTIQAAEDLGIEYITARGTTGEKASVFKPEGYNVTILSVSNIQKVNFEYGSLCDYSFYERAGSPENMESELDNAIKPLTEKEKYWYGNSSKITPVSHTYIGGNLKDWNEMWINFWDESEVNWVSLDEFMATPDWTMPLWQIPTNKNNPYSSEKIRPLYNYSEEEKVNNLCAI